MHVPIFRRLGMAWQLEMIIMFSTYHAPLPPTMPLFKPAFLAALDSSFTSLFNDFWDVTTTTGNVHCIPCRLTGRKMRGKTFAQWFCKSAKRKVHKPSTTHFDSSIPLTEIDCCETCLQSGEGAQKQTHHSPPFYSPFSQFWLGPLSVLAFKRSDLLLLWSLTST